LTLAACLLKSPHPPAPSKPILDIITIEKVGDMTLKICASLALALAAPLAVGAAFAQAPAAPATAPAPAVTPAPASAAPSAAAPAAATPKAAATPAAAAAAAKPADDILAVAAKAGNFKTLATMLDAADLTKVLKGKGPFTVFAPSDEAFAKLTKEQIEALTTPKFKPLLGSMLGAHVLSGKALKADSFIAAKAQSVRMTNSSYVLLDAKDGKTVKFGGSLVTKADIEASNGIIHVIDTVYLPKRVKVALFAIDKTNKAAAAAGPALQKAKEVGGKALDKAKEVGGKAVEATKDAAGKAVDKAKEVTSPTPAPAPAPK
jgi:uncharacterized surface protein with fasciclin (FAS1) repeats